MDLLDAFFLVFFSFYLGWKAREWRAESYIRSIMEQHEEELGLEEEEADEEEDLNVVEIEIEQHEGRYFAYQKDTKSYMANATTVELLAEELIKNHPKIDKFKIYTL